jgi:hypothetical protein
VRQRVVQCLIDWAPLQPIVEDRVFEASAVVTQVKRPFIVVRMHTGFPVERGIGGRHYAQVWAHDAPGSYLRIDQILIEARKAIESLPHTGADGFLEARWIETGVDLKDDTLGTITRYSRYQLTQALRELYG